MKINKIIALTKIFLKNSFNTLRSTENNQKKNKGMKVMYAIAFLYLVGIMGFLSYTMISQLVQIQQEAVFLGVFFMGIATLLIFQSIFSTINIFYFSKDIEYVLPWPLSPKEILAAKFNVILITEYVVELIAGFIPLLLYGIITGAGFFYYIFAALLLLVFPIVPLLIVCFFVMIIMSFAKFTKRKDTFQLIATIILIVVIIGIQFVAGNQSEKMTEDQMLQMLTKANGVVEMIQDYFITLKPTIQALTNTNVLLALLEIVKVVGITILSYFVFIVAGNRLYLRGVVGNLVGGTTKKKEINVEKVYRQQNKGVSYVKKEFKILFRNPIFFMQCIMPAVLMPILFSMVLFVGSQSQEGSIGELVTQITDPQSSIVALVLLGAMQFLGMMLYIAITAISRDGASAVFTKYMPVSYYQQFICKMLPNVIMNAICNSIVLGVFYYLMPTVSILFLIAILILGTLLGGIQSYLMLMVDLKRPKLQWNTEYAVVKQNMNLIFPMALGLVNIVMIALLAFAFANLPVVVTIGILLLAFAGINYVLDRYVYRHQVALFEKIV